jgi:protein-disulfide isomerase
MVPSSESSLSRQRPRWLGVAIIAVIALILLFVIASLSLDEGEIDPIEITGVSEVQKLVGGIQQDERVLGDDDAPVTVQVFNDLQCLPCGDYQLEDIDPLIEDEVRGGDVKLEFHHFSTGARNTGVAAYAAVAAGLQDYQWQYIELFFRNQEEGEAEGVTEEFLEEVASRIVAFNVEQWQRDFDEPEVQEQVEADAELVAELRLPAEPAVIVIGPGGSRTLEESPPVAEIREAIGQVG